MNVLLLGNGFDLHHNLPTKYINFLNTVKCLSEINLSENMTIGSIFGNRKLRSVDKGIAESFNKYRDIYCKIDIDLEKLTKLSHLSDNVWFSYLYKSFNDDKGWIDFEKEIAEVIDELREILKDDNPDIGYTKNYSKKTKYIVNSFDFFIDSNVGVWRVNKDYVIEYPYGSGNEIKNKQKIVDVIINELKVLADGLKIYLDCFVENTLQDIYDEYQFKWTNGFQFVNRVVSFNYTNTYEKLYGKIFDKDIVFHIHGNVTDQIVLGINPDEFDELDKIDTLFLSFKKYFQRVLYKTDVNYLNYIKSTKKYNDIISLYVIGHSLDITDKDIIQEMFSIASEIFILNYDDFDEAKHITNLVQMYGKYEFDKLRSEKNLTFLPINGDFVDRMYLSST